MRFCHAAAGLLIQYHLWHEYPARADYNDAVVRSNDRQLLLNLIRLHYRNTPFFMSVSNVTSRYTLSYNGSARIPNFEGSNIETSVSLSGSGTFIESPTVVYNPVIGEQFIRELLTPIPPENIALLAQSGWSIERIFILSVQEIDNIFNAPSAPGPTLHYAPQFNDFLQLAELLRETRVGKEIALD